MGQLTGNPWFWPSNFPVLLILCTLEQVDSRPAVIGASARKQTSADFFRGCDLVSARRVTVPSLHLPSIFAWFRIARWPSYIIGDHSLAFKLRVGSPQSTTHTEHLCFLWRLYQLSSISEPILVLRVTSPWHVIQRGWPTLTNGRWFPK